MMQDNEDQISKLKQSINEYEDVIADKNAEKDELKNKTIEQDEMILILKTQLHEYQAGY